jgi:hypothetical protein
MIGYKGFNSDWTSNSGFQYEIGKTYKMNSDEIVNDIVGDPKAKGFHYCQIPMNVLQLYYLNGFKYARILAKGKIIENCLKSVTNEMEILEEVSRDQICNLTNGLFEIEGKYKFWYLNCRLHRDDGPAFEGPNGMKKWYLNGFHHRMDGPAVEHYYGDNKWYLNGYLHRVDGPAVENDNGYKQWYLNGHLHRIDGPAIIDTDGDFAWYLNDRLHRLDGPAIEKANGDFAWYQNDVKHRLDGPAIEKANGLDEWYINGKKVICLSFSFVVLAF